MITLLFAVILAWDPGATSATGYKLHYGPVSGSPSIHLDVGNVLTRTVDDAELPIGSTIYFTATAYNATGESGPSNEVAYVVPITGVPDKLRFFPRTGGFAGRMLGGIFEGTNGNPVTGPYTVLHTITVTPPNTWTEVQTSLGGFRYLRYRGPANSYCNVAEVEFYRNGAKLTGTKFGSPGSWGNTGNTFDKALDGDTVTRFDAPDAGANHYTGIDTQ